MKCQYIGKSEEHDYREACITYNEPREETKFNAMCDYLIHQGWKVYCTQKCVTIPVSDKEEYTRFLVDYKKAKTVWQYARELSVKLINLRGMEMKGGKTNGVI